MAASTGVEYDLGVLFVHGIGDQPRASTLVDFGTPLIEWLADRAQQLGGSVAVSRACLTPGDDEAASAELRIDNAGAAQEGALRSGLVAWGMPPGGVSPADPLPVTRADPHPGGRSGRRPVVRSNCTRA